MDVFDAAEKYQQAGHPLLILAGKEYGSGSSRDWAAKGPFLLVRLVVNLIINRHLILINYLLILTNSHSGLYRNRFGCLGQDDQCLSGNYMYGIKCFSSTSCTHAVLLNAVSVSFESCLHAMPLVKKKCT